MLDHVAPRAPRHAHAAILNMKKRPLEAAS
jgi:hypothetical protein